jgi:histidine ammonia-lyase
LSFPPNHDSLLSNAAITLIVKWRAKVGPFTGLQQDLARFAIKPYRTMSYRCFKKFTHVHACSTGDMVNADIVKLMLFLKAHALSLGHSGVQVATVERIIDFYNNDVIPVVYDRGSVGASGDLAPLANLFLPLIGMGEVQYKG